MPIESAPKDGTFVLVSRDRWTSSDNQQRVSEVVIARYVAIFGPGSEEWYGVNVAGLDGQRTVSSLTIGGEIGKAEMFKGIGPTHWMPLPEPPSPTSTPMAEK